VNQRARRAKGIYVKFSSLVRVREGESILRSGEEV
jgi:hypothetical protein